MFTKSDLLYIGTHHQHPNGTLQVVFPMEGSADALVLREVLALFDAEITYIERNGCMFGTNLAFSELSKLDRADSFPVVIAAQRAQEKEEAERQRQIDAKDEAIRLIEQRKLDEHNKRLAVQHAEELAEIAQRREIDEREDADRRASQHADQKAKFDELEKVTNEILERHDSENKKKKTEDRKPNRMKARQAR